MTLLLAAALLASACCEKPPVTPKPNLVGVWHGAWMERYVNEYLVIRPVEGRDDRFWLNFLMTSDIPFPTERDYYATFVDNALLLDNAHNMDGHEFLLLSLELEGEELAMVAYPHGTSMMDAGDVPFAFRRMDRDLPSSYQWFIDESRAR
ncbi:MAG: hypothetical protein ACI8QS_003717 [Planctomycetota bacterium]|jgi:hypothetical protein